MSSELITHLVIDAVITFTILYYIKKHIKETEDFYDESRIEWERRQETDKRLEQKLNNYLSMSGLENKKRLSQMSKEKQHMKMYLDDLRTPIEEFDFVVRNYDEAISIIKEYGVPNFISFDHDLGIDSEGKLLKSGYDLAKWLVDSDLDDKCKLPFDFSFKVHSQNPVGKQNIISLLEGYLKHKNNLPQEINKTSKISRNNQNLLTHYLSNMSKPHSS